jgi:fluoride ion exporter CrcB/FEX
MNAALTYLNIAVFAMAGAIAREGIEHLTLFHGSFTESGLVWANFGGCIVMGWVNATNLFENVEKERGVTKKQLPLFLGIGTGFCGSLTSFSTLMLEGFLYGANQNDTKLGYPNVGYGVQSVMSIGLINFGLSFAGLKVGHHLADLVPLPPLSSKVERLLSSFIAAASIALFCIFIIFAGLWKSWRWWTYLGLFGIPGALLRWQLSKLNGKLPLGTFSANILACIVLAVCVLLQRGKTNTSSTQLVHSFLQCQILDGIMNGFCGCLSTISTFVNEMYGMNYKRAYIYGFATSFVGFSMMVIIVGSFAWTQSLVSPAC